MVTNPHSPTTREAIALEEVGHTDVRPATVRFLLAFFLLSIAAVPLFELVSGGLAARTGGRAPWEHLTRLPQEMRVAVTTAGVDH